MMDLIQSLEERKMTDAEMEMDKREKIVLSLQKEEKRESKIDMG